VTELQEWLQIAGLQSISKETAHGAVDLRASECNGSSREDGAINNSPTERDFCHGPYASQPLY